MPACPGELILYACLNRRVSSQAVNIDQRVQKQSHHEGLHDPDQIAAVCIHELIRCCIPAPRAVCLLQSSEILDDDLLDISEVLCSDCRTICFHSACLFRE